MAKAFKCDRCGTYYDKDEADYNRPFLTKDYGPGYEDIDLCPNCLKQLYDWWDNIDAKSLNPMYGPVAEAYDNAVEASEIIDKNYPHVTSEEPSYHAQCCLNNVIGYLSDALRVSGYFVEENTNG